MFNDDERPAVRYPDIGMAATKAEEPAVIRAARQFEEARQTLNRYQLERRKLDEEMKAATHRMSEAANVLHAEIDSVSEARSELRRLV